MEMKDTDWTVEDMSMDGVKIWSGDGDLVAEVYSNMGLGVDAIDRAERIVKAVGAFDALIKIYEAAKAWQDMDGIAASLKKSPFTGRLIIQFSDEWTKLSLRLTNAINEYEQAQATLKLAKE